jgi:quercetin dioxygenase-like cupin family protein
VERKIDFAALEWMEWADVGTGRAKTALIPGSRVRLVQFSPGFRQTTWCDRDHVGYVLEGEMLTEFEDGRTIAFRAGDGIVIPAGCKHKSTNVGEGPVTLFVVEKLGRGPSGPPALEAITEEREPSAAGISSEPSRFEPGSSGSN